MSRDRWQQIDQLLDAALELEASERAQFLNQACAGDEALRKELESRLASDEPSRCFIEQPAPVVTAKAAASHNEEQLAGRLISHYKVLSLLGAGGMGKVYLAEDLRLARSVAIKWLPPPFTIDKDRLRRFELEARAASALNHPNIITIHDIGAFEDARFIVTEFIDGETLRRRMATFRPTLHEALDISIQIAEALAAAHEVGIIHRDIKPENVMLRRDGYVKVLDFGLAKLIERRAQPVNAEASTMAMIDTESGVRLGTVRYMSPEQARGIHVDARTDVFSLGVVLYEIIAGHAPFQGETTTDVLLSILQTDPPPLARSSPETPEELERIVARALTKDRDKRYQTVSDFGNDLKRLKKRLEVSAEIEQVRQPLASQEALAAQLLTGATGGGGIRTADDVTHTREDADNLSGKILRHKKVVLATLVLLAVVIAGVVYLLAKGESGEAIDTLAVLPFVNASQDPNAEYLSDGIIESLINSLSQLPNLKVQSRNSVFRYKVADGTAMPDARRIGQELNVRAVLMGRVVQRGDNLSISAELIDVHDNTQIWGVQYNRRLADVLALQVEIARQILEKLRLKLTGEDKELVTKRYTDNTEAYQLYLRGRYHLNKRSAEAIKRGRDFFQQAIEKDPAYALAYSGISDSYQLLAAQAAISPREGFPAALAAAKKSVELDAALGEGHASLAHANFHMNDLPAAEQEFARAIEINPNYPSAYQWQSEYLQAAGRRDEAFAAARKALELDPLNLAANAQLAYLLITAQEYDQAIAHLKRTLEIDPHFFLAHAHLGRIYLETKRFPEAIAEYKQVATLTGGSRGLGPLGLAYATSGQRGEALRVLDEMEARSKENYMDALEVAQLCAALKERGLTLAWLERAVKENPHSVNQIKKDKSFDFLRSDPRFIKLL